MTGYEKDLSELLREIGGKRLDTIVRNVMPLHAGKSLGILGKPVFNGNLFGGRIVTEQLLFQTVRTRQARQYSGDFTSL